MSIETDISQIFQLIKDLVSIPSPSGYTDQIITHIEKDLAELNVSTTRNRKGGLIVTLPGTDTSQQRMVTAHVDALGAMVKEIKSDGRLKLTTIGGSRWNHLEGEYCQIFTAADKSYTGTILMHQTSVHVYDDAGSAKRNEDNIEVRIDELVHNADDVRNLGIEVGDFVAFDPRVEITSAGFIKSRHLDDKASVGILMYLITLIKNQQLEFPYTTHFLISNNEEIGYGGNSNIPLEVVEYLAVDMGAIGDGQTSDEYSVSICAKDSSGPYNYKLRQKLVSLAEEHNINYQVDIYPYYGSDASAALRAGHDIIHGLIGPGIDASHAYERTHEKAIINTTKLVFHYLFSKMIS